MELLINIAIIIAFIVFIVVGLRLFWYFLEWNDNYDYVAEFRHGILGKILQLIVIITLAVLFGLIFEAVQDLPNQISNPLK
jgi:preprotein translocase subunit SecY